MLHFHVLPWRYKEAEESAWKQDWLNLIPWQQQILSRRIGNWHEPI
jgi:hypothetical protein